MCDDTHPWLAEPEDRKGQGTLTVFGALSARSRAPHGPCNFGGEQGGE